MNKISLVVVIACGLFLLWFFTRNLGDEYLEKNVMWHVSGTVADVKTGKPLNGVELHVHCREAATSKYRELSIAVPSTNFVVKVGDDGCFAAQVFGGSIFLEFHRQGYLLKNWASDTAKGRPGDVTNLLIMLTK
jgi:hypothetical protein